MRCSGNGARKLEKQNTQENRVWVRKPEGKGQLGKPKCVVQNNIKNDRKEIACEEVDWLICLRIGKSEQF
jgi:hypothetical protein